jgi:hypothetical protein
MSMSTGDEVSPGRRVPVEAAGEAAVPRCECHSVPMLWHKEPDRKNGGRWRCRIQRQERERRLRGGPSQTCWRCRLKLKRARIQDASRQAHKRQLVRAELERRGGHCVYPGCKETKGVHWHHRDSRTKTTKVSTLVQGGKSPSRLIAELAKCDPLCPAHHRAVHRELRSAKA